MEIGPDFDDGFFEQPKIRSKKKSSSYKAKFQDPLWFLNENIDGRPNMEAIVILKHQADYFYYYKNYAKAANLYEQGLKLIQPNNNTWRREFLENLARCMLHEGNPQAALDWALKLNGASINADQNVVSMNLMADVCHALGKYKEELEALHYCLQTHKNSPQYWMRLGYCYAGLFSIQLPGNKPLLKSSEVEMCCAFKSKTFSTLPSSPKCPVGSMLEQVASKLEAIASSSSVSPPQTEPDTPKCDVCTIGTQMISSCFIKTSALIDSGGRSTMAGNRYTKMKEMIEISFKHMEIGPLFIEEAFKLLGTDFLYGLQETESTASTSGEKNNLTTLTANQTEVSSEKSADK